MSDEALSVQVLAEYKNATVGLRDAELALKAAQERYRRALTALNSAIAPVQPAT